MTVEADLDQAKLAAVVRQFYGRARLDPELGPVFEAGVHDWEEHLERITAFWSSVMLKSGAYKGDPLAAHMRHRDAIRPELFDRWLALWAETTAELVPGEVAAALQKRAAMIAESLKLAMFFRIPAD